MPNESNQYRDQRLSNLMQLEAAGYAPYGAAFERTDTLAGVRRDFAVDQTVRAAGRLVRLRAMGKTLFADLHDGSDRFQLFVQVQALGAGAFEAFKLLDLGDTIGVEGALFVTRMGEPTIRVTGWILLSKALRPLPEKWHGLRDTEACYRQRYLDLIANPDSRDRFNRRIAMVAAMRAFLNQRGFQEVETPMMQAQPGGAAAKPFVTHYEALGATMYLRIAPELYLKQLLVGGFERVFELNRNFRNEGLDRTHNPEFTMLEVYQAYADKTAMQTLVQAMILHVAETVFGSLAVGEGETRIDLSPPWREIAYADLIRETMGKDWYALDKAAARQRAETEGLDIDPAWGHLEITHEVYEKRIEKHLRNPTFVTRLPSALVPLAKACPDAPDCADVFELVIAGQEVAPGYTEQNDPRAQRQRFLEQAGTERQNVDETFLLALEHGMPPAGGMGLGVDRLAMILSGVEAIRDVILFPQLRDTRTPAVE